MLAVAVWQVFEVVLECYKGVVAFKTHSGVVIFEYNRVDEPTQFWLLLILKFVLLVFIAIVAMKLMDVIK